MEKMTINGNNDFKVQIVMEIRFVINVITLGEFPTTIPNLKQSDVEFNWQNYLQTNLK